MKCVVRSCKESYPEIPMTILGLSVPSLMMHQLSDEVRRRHSSMCNWCRMGTPFILIIFINGSPTFPIFRVPIQSAIFLQFLAKTNCNVDCIIETQEANRGDKWLMNLINWMVTNMYLQISIVQWSRRLHKEAPKPIAMNWDEGDKRLSDCDNSETETVIKERLSWDRFWIGDLKNRFSVSTSLIFLLLCGPESDWCVAIPKSWPNTGWVSNQKNLQWQPDQSLSNLNSWFDATQTTRK